MTLDALMHKIHATIARNDGMFVCLAKDFPLVQTWVQVMDLPICCIGGAILLRFHKPRFAHTASGSRIAIITYHDGRYYTANGLPYREKELIWEK
jgi:hypothetical protein